MMQFWCHKIVNCAFHLQMDTIEILMISFASYTSSSIII
jgi:hypothetical protein